MDQVVNWFVNSACNLPCAYCFRERDLEEKGTEGMLRLVKVLGKNKVKRVTIGGGEPLLRSDLERILAALKEEGIFVSLHTNGTILKQRIKGLRGLVDILSLPIDSVEEGENQQMRGRPYVGLIEEIMGYAHPEFKLAFKTTATRVNWASLPKIYDLVRQVPFDYWKVYQFRPLNEAQVYDSTFALPDKTFEGLRAELSGLADRRIQVVNRKEGHQPYVFLDNQGNVSTVHPDLEQNIPVGNLFEADLEAIGGCIDAIYGEGSSWGFARKVRINWRSPENWCLVKERGEGTFRMRVVTATRYDDPRLAYFSDD
ncbi:MAG TPA: radical SAM protein [Candidatus Nanoarchaeia archaeon]|nr:radical SAM protein [Candidatus Nanoarchaeia archaeon]